MGTTELNRRDQVTAPNSWPSSRRETGAKVDNQVAAPTESRTPNWQRAKIAQQRLRMEAMSQVAKAVFCPRLPFGLCLQSDKRVSAGDLQRPPRRSCVVVDLDAE